MLDDLHRRYLQQASWTAPLRQYLLARSGVGASAKVIEVGCGTGAVCPTLHDYTQRPAFGIDLSLGALRFARTLDPSDHFACADALALPYPDGAFDAACCHFLLLWVPQAQQAVNEMRRVTRPGGAVLALAEPDYGGRVDYPDELAALGRMQAQSLKERGAQPEMGRRLAGLFHAAGLERVESGVMGGQWAGLRSAAERTSEWETLRRDLGDKISAAEMASLEAIDRSATVEGSRVLFVPTFYALGFKAA